MSRAWSRVPLSNIQNYGRWAPGSSDGDASRSDSNSAAGIGGGNQESLNLFAAAPSQQGELAARLELLPLPP